MRTALLMSIVLALSPACDKKTDTSPPGVDPKAPPAAMEPKAETPPAATDPKDGSAAPAADPKAGEAVPPAAAGSGEPAIVDSVAGAVKMDAGGPGAGTPGAGAADASYDKAAFLADPLCVQVADKIRACADKPEFVAALDDGATAQQKKVNARLRRGVKKWQTSHELCTNAWDIMNYEHTGFLDNPVPLKAADALSSCATLGTAVKAAGGLVGGDTGE
jgi:hypothetical protein